MTSSNEFDIPDNIKYIQEGPFFYDNGRFFIWLTRWGTYSSADADGNRLVTGIDKEAVEFFTREKLNGYPNCTTIVTKEELDYWCKEYPNLSRQEVSFILECIEIEGVKDKFWRDNPTLPEDAVNKVVAENAAASFEHHLYREFNNEAP